jgi:hypothetical protein
VFPFKPKKSIMEVWKSINIDGCNFESLYSVSNTGRVRNNKIGRLYASCPNSRGYIIVCLIKYGFRKTFQVHRLVATAFIDNSEKLPQVNHINGNRADNRVENLEWCTNSYNTKHGYDLARARGYDLARPRKPGALGQDYTHHFNNKLALGNNPKAKKVVNTRTGEQFGSAAEVALRLGITRRSFCKRLSGELQNNTEFAYLN